MRRQRSWQLRPDDKGGHGDPSESTVTATTEAEELDDSDHDAAFTSNSDHHQQQHLSPNSCSNTLGPHVPLMQQWVHGLRRRGPLSPHHHHHPQTEGTPPHSPFQTTGRRHRRPSDRLWQRSQDDPKEVTILVEPVSPPPLSPSRRHRSNTHHDDAETQSLQNFGFHSGGIMAVSTIVGSAAQAQKALLQKLHHHHPLRHHHHHTNNENKHNDRNDHDRLLRHDHHIQLEGSSNTHGDQAMIQDHRESLDDVDGVEDHHGVHTTTQGEVDTHESIQLAHSFPPSSSAASLKRVTSSLVASLSPSCYMTPPLPCSPSSLHSPIQKNHHVYGLDNVIGNKNNANFTTSIVKESSNHYHHVEVSSPLTTVTVLTADDDDVPDDHDDDDDHNSQSEEIQTHDDNNDCGCMDRTCCCCCQQQQQQHPFSASRCSSRRNGKIQTNQSDDDDDNDVVNNNNMNIRTMDRLALSTTNVLVPPCLLSNVNMSTAMVTTNTTQAMAYTHKKQRSQKVDHAISLPDTIDNTCHDNNVSHLLDTLDDDNDDDDGGCTQCIESKSCEEEEEEEDENDKESALAPEPPVSCDRQPNSITSITCATTTMESWTLFFPTQNNNQIDMTVNVSCIESDSSNGTYHGNQSIVIVDDDDDGSESQSLAVVHSEWCNSQTDVSPALIDDQGVDSSTEDDSKQRVVDSRQAEEEIKEDALDDIAMAQLEVSSERLNELFTSNDRSVITDPFLSHEEEQRTVQDLFDGDARFGTSMMEQEENVESKQSSTHFCSRITPDCSVRIHNPSNMHSTDSMDVAPDHGDAFFHIEAAPTSTTFASTTSLSFQSVREYQDPDSSLLHSTVGDGMLELTGLAMNLDMTSADTQQNVVSIMTKGNETESFHVLVPSPADTAKLSFFTTTMDNVDKHAAAEVDVEERVASPALGVALVSKFDEIAATTTASWMNHGDHPLKDDLLKDPYDGNDEGGPQHEEMEQGQVHLYLSLCCAESVSSLGTAFSLSSHCTDLESLPCSIVVDSEDESNQVTFDDDDNDVGLEKREDGTGVKGHSTALDIGTSSPYRAKKPGIRTAASSSASTNLIDEHRAFLRQDCGVASIDNRSSVDRKDNTLDIKHRLLLVRQNTPMTSRSTNSSSSSEAGNSSHWLSVKRKVDHTVTMQRICRPDPLTIQRQDTVISARKHSEWEEETIQDDASKVSDDDQSMWVEETVVSSVMLDAIVTVSSQDGTTSVWEEITVEESIVVDDESKWEELTVAEGPNDDERSVLGCGASEGQGAMQGAVRVNGTVSTPAFVTGVDHPNFFTAVDAANTITAMCTSRSVECDAVSQAVEVLSSVTLNNLVVHIKPPAQDASEVVEPFSPSSLLSRNEGLSTAVPKTEPRNSVADNPCCGPGPEAICVAPLENSCLDDYEEMQKRVEVDPVLRDNESLAVHVGPSVMEPISSSCLLASSKGLSNAASAVEAANSVGDNPCLGPEPEAICVAPQENSFLKDNEELQKRVEVDPALRSNESLAVHVGPSVIEPISPSCLLASNKGLLNAASAVEAANSAGDKTCLGSRPEGICVAPQENSFLEDYEEMQKRVEIDPVLRGNESLAAHVGPSVIEPISPSCLLASNKGLSNGASVVEAANSAGDNPSLGPGHEASCVAPQENSFLEDYEEMPKYKLILDDEPDTQPMYSLRIDDDDVASEETDSGFNYPKSIPSPSDSHPAVFLTFLSPNIPTKVVSRVFDESWRILKPGGMLFVIDVDGQTVHRNPKLRQVVSRVMVPGVKQKVHEIQIQEMLRSNGYKIKDFGGCSHDIEEAEAIVENVSKSKRHYHLSRWSGVKPIKQLSIQPPKLKTAPSTGHSDSVHELRQIWCK